MAFQAQLLTLVHGDRFQWNIELRCLDGFYRNDGKVAGLSKRNMKARKSAA